jgi:phosphate/sulfate permease
MSKSRNEVVQESKVKGFTAGVAAAATVALGVTLGAPVAAVAAVPAAVLGWRWWKHRAENGLRF